MNSYLRNLYVIRILKQFIFLSYISLPVIINGLFNLCGNYLTEDELSISLKSIQNNKTTGIDGLTKESQKTFWNEIKYVFLKPPKQDKEKSQLSISQYQAVIKLIEEKIVIKSTLKTGEQYHYLTLIQKLY